MILLLKKIQAYFVEKREINYLYFSIFLICLIFFTFSYFLLLEHPILGVQLFFLFYAFGQAFLETWVFILITCLLTKWAPRWILFLFISASFLLLLFHFTHFTMIRLMDISIYYPFKFLFGAGIKHLAIGFQALNMNVGMAILMILCLLFIPFGGVVIYWGTNHIAKKKPLTVSLNQIFSALLVTGSLLLFLDFLAQPYINRIMYRKYKKTLPFGTTFLGTNIQSMELDSPLAPPLSEDEIQEKMRSITTQSKPNLYFFVLETLRKDCINEQIAPHLAAFGKENIDIQTSFANANGTHLSWFSIFYSEFPFHWTSIRDERNRGATSLQLLKQLGYKIRVYAALDLHYFEMDRVLFGDKRQLIDQIEEFSSDRTLEPCDRDALCINSFKRDLETEEGKDGNVYLFFLDSTHSEYSFPQNFPLKFTPSAKTIDYLTLSAKEVAPVINRYRNSISYLDGLMGDFFQILKQKELYETSIIAITGDHGEEFFEEGALFHGTHLNRYQTEVPIFFKCPGHTSWAEEATHIDMFPSLFHHLTKSSDFSLLFQGSSIFSQNRSPYRVSVMQNSADIPNELCIGKGKNKLHIRFLSSKDIYNQRQVEIITLDMPNELSNTPEDTLIQNYLKYLQ